MSEVVTIQVVPEQARIVIDEGADTLRVIPGPDVVQVVSTAATGARGPAGPPGPPGGGTYIHDQAVPSTTWVIAHGLNRFAPVAVVDSTSRAVIPGEVIYDSPDQITVTFAAAFGGRAYL